VIAEQSAQAAAALGFPPSAAAAIAAVAAQAEAIKAAPTPAIVPMLPLRNAVAFPEAMIPIDVTRASSLRAIEAAVASEHRFIAIFAQRARDTEQPTQDDLHTQGCLCVVLYHQPGEAGRPSRMLIRGIRWIMLDAIEHTEPFYAARVSDAGGVDRGDDQEIAALDQRLRDTARRFANTLPTNREEVLAFIEQTQDIGKLADAAMAHTSSGVSESADYTRETQLARRIERAIAALDAALARGSAAAPPA
jgi:ATP-dependent Lon protease